MRITHSIRRTLLGLGAAASLFLGCQQFTGEEDGSRDAAGDPDAPSDLSLQLRIKPTPECLELRRLVLAADSAGAPTVTLQTDFVKRCLEEVKPGDGHGGVIPPDQVPDLPSQCRWLVAQVDSGRVELIAKLRHHCPEECGQAAPEHPDRCREPKPDTLPPADHPPKDTAVPPHHPPEDTLIPPPPPQPSLCDSLHKALAALDPASEAYGIAKAKLHDLCPPPGPVVEPPPPCAEMRKQLAALDPATDKYASLEKHIHAVCPADTMVPHPPKENPPPPPPVPSVCDSLRHALSLVDPVADPQTYGDLKHRLHDACPPPDPVLPPKPVYTPESCAKMREELAAMSSVPEKQANYAAFIDSVCPAVH